MIKKRMNTAQIPITLNVHEPWFSHLRNGNKSVEGRLNRGKFAQIRIGDVLILQKSGNVVRKTPNVVFVVHAIKKYSSFLEYLSQEGLARTLPGTKTIDEGVKVYHAFCNSDDERKYGIAAIHVKRL
jgi:ASC-1-like (ASCH) protein